MPAAWFLVSSKIQASRLSFMFCLQKLLPFSPCSFNLQAQDVVLIRGQRSGHSAAKRRRLCWMNVVGFVDQFVLVECVRSLHSRPLNWITFSQCCVL